MTSDSKKFKQPTLFELAFDGGYGAQESGMRNTQRQLSQEYVQPATATLSKSQLQEPEGLQSSLLQIAIRHTRELTADDKYRLLTTVQDDIRDDELDTRSFPAGDSEGKKRKVKQITFQRRWLREDNWLRYGKSRDDKGGWCLLFILFLTPDEMRSLYLGVFVRTPFVNYNKSKEIRGRHATTEYHSRAVDRAYYFRMHYFNPEARIDNRMTDINARNYKFNLEVVPTIVEAVIMRGKQRIALLLAGTNSCLDQHLRTGPANAKYISKNIQNEILEIAADQIRDFYRECLRECAHFSVVADEVTSHGREILSVCLRFLEVQKHKIDIRNCRGQAYDTTSSMSSSSVQAHIKRVAPDADYQGCCLHSLNLVICKSSQITAIRNMFDSCQQAYLFFHNCRKRQRFLEHVISCQCPATKKTKINGLCKTRWPSNCDKLYPDGSNWKWDSETRTAANGLRYTFVGFEHIVVFILVKQLLEPIRPIAECLQARLQELYFGFKKVDEVVQFYKRIRNDVDVEHNRIYAKAKKLAADIGSDEAMPRIMKRKQTRANPTVLLPYDYWRVTLTIPFLDSILSELESRFASDKRAHFELCVLVPEVIAKNESLEETVGILTSDANRG
ncbi:uncharacterized protein LOC134194370 [Corticium candelabrum]|uniref:uncharacterized protein LOC134194370 n=1 Tax=Corticium candelabrum TaxID=121492 RepID=UPI002E257B02|nr:uncharacterized protein LOC134194370 [Corticium candelabrum]